MPSNPLQDGLRLEPTPGPTTLVIFGATGDLTRRKLLPAVYNLSRGQRLPARFSVLGVGRETMILRGGFNVYPRELEEVLLTHPAVSLAAVIGVPDPRMGEEVKAFIVRKPGASVTEEMLVDWCREQFASYKYPRIVEFKDSLPIGATGKILKRELKSA